MRLSDLDPNRTVRHDQIERAVRARIGRMQAPVRMTTSTLLIARVVISGAALAATIAGVALLRPHPAERPIVASIGLPTPAELLAMRNGAR